MNATVVTCPSCKNPLPQSLCNTGTMTLCPSCDITLRAEVFPAFFKGAAIGLKAETIVEEGTSSCFYHEKKKAVIHCDACGRFLCALCDLDISGSHVCPACAESGRKKGNVAELETSRTVYDSAALTLALGAFLVWPVAIVTAPAAMYLAALSWRRPGSLIPRTRLRSYLAIVIALLQLVGFAFLTVLIIRESSPAMSTPAIAYKKVPGSGSGAFQTSRLYIGPDHLLLVTSAAWNENYRRFYFRDIQALVLCRTEAGKVQNAIWGLLIFLTSVIATQVGAGATVAWSFAGAFALGLLVNTLRGPAFACHVHTAVQTTRLISLGRRPRAQTTLAQLKQLIDAAQGTTTEHSATIHPRSDAIPPAPGP